MTLFYIKVDTNAVADDFRRIIMARHAHKLVDTILEEDICDILCLGSLFFSDNSDCFSLYIEEIPFPLDHHIVEAEQKLELQTELSTNIRTNINKDNSDCKYMLVKGINLIHYRDRIYVPKPFANVF